ncbi:3-phosphoshikimate 1-carboxyvinyltransferase [Spirochaetia bacterium]|nr:3-phosphoshikimate 1-carboxyvinyltransferase [Spirochaetia bacterium]
MNVTITPHKFCKTVSVPASKSHTIRRLLIAAFADGVSKIDFPLDSSDARSCLSVCRALGAEIIEKKQSENSAVIESWTVKGIGGAYAIAKSQQPLDVGNSGTTLFLAMALASLGGTPVTWTGDEQIARRSAAPLLDALQGLGVSVQSGKDGCVPFTLQGPWHGGKVSINCPTSQYLSALLLAAPLAGKGVTTQIEVPLLNEKPYIEMTLAYLEKQGVIIEKTHDFSHFSIKGACVYKPVNGGVAGDFSSAAFPACAAAVSGGTVKLLGLDPEDFQGDKAFFEMLKKMGCSVEWKTEAAADGGKTHTVTVSGGGTLKGAEFDLNDTPDLLPAAAVLGAFAKGETRLVNAAHARIKETDRIAVMAAELSKLGVHCTERPDGLIIQGGRPLSGGCVDGHNDHRVVMALAAAALGAQAPITVLGAEAADITYPNFFSMFDV